LREAKRDQELMTEEEKNEQTEESTVGSPQSAEPQADEAAEPQVAEPQAEADADSQPAEETAADEAAGGDESAADEPAVPAADAEPGETLTPKQQRKLERARHTGDARPQRSPEQRAGERATARSKKAAERSRVRARARSKHEPGVGTPPAERRPGSRKVRQGTVVSSKADKTITVRIEVVRRHPVYEKVVRRSATIHAHDEGNDANAGDVVRVIESRPRSRTKRWRLVEVLERAR
jgi:small subunit ribosomal protein S17